MDCEEARLAVQALIDSELPEEEIEKTLSHIESCYACRKTYIDLLTVKRELKGVSFPGPKREWFEDLEKNRARRGFSLFGKIAFLGSYVLLVVYAVISFLKTEKQDLFTVILFAGIAAGALVLLGVTIADRMRERKSDRYREVMK